MVAPRLHGKDAPLVGDEPMVEEFRTPKGKAMLMAVRPGTADHNNVFSCATEDEYRLRDLELDAGTALDIGAHIGGVAVGLALDHPAAWIIAVECLSANIDLLRQNVLRNGVADRVSILHAIAGAKHGKGTVRWNFAGGESAQHHRFIANVGGVAHTGADEEEVERVTLADLATDEIDFIKIDCEGGEYDFLRGSALGRVREIRGEFHAGFDRLVEQLDVTHLVTLTSGTEGFGGFRALRR